MKRLFLALLCLAPSLFANAANGDPRLERLFASFIAPCCWRENLLHHQSPKADELRTELRHAVAAGRSDEDMKRSLVDRYSLRILSMPEGARLQWLRWIPLVGIAAGLAAIALFLRRSLAVHRNEPSPVHTALPLLPEFEEI
nr:cytochrome c-type biogenesis protein CcmH [Bryobacter aggregatus]